jgi:hypothetical protein
MFLLDWYKQWKQIRSDFFQPPVCASCEALKETVNSLQYQNSQLLAALTRTPPTEPRVDLGGLKPVLPHRIPWKQQRQMLEAEDRHNAQLLRKKQEEMNPRPTTPIATVASTTLEELEREVGVVDEDAGKERETNTA